MGRLTPIMRSVAEALVNEGGEPRGQTEAAAHLGISPQRLHYNLNRLLEERILSAAGMAGGCRPRFAPGPEYWRMGPGRRRELPEEFTRLDLLWGYV